MSKSLSRRSFLKAAALGTAGAALAACQAAGQTEQPTQAAGQGQSEATSAPSSNNAPAKEKQKVTFTMYGHPGLIEEMVPIFNQSQPDVEVEFERSEGQGYNEKLTAAVAAGSMWDSFRTDLSQALNWGVKGALLDVRKFLDADKQYPGSDYIPGVLDVFTVEGKTYGVPTWATTMWLFYNQKMFDEAGISYPTTTTTWPEYIEMAKKLTKRDGDRITQFGMASWDSWTFPVAQVVWSNGGKFYYNDDLTKVAVDDPKTVEALQLLADMIHVEKVAPNPNVPASSPVGLLNDNVATVGDGDWLPWDNNEVFSQKADYLDATLCPTFDGQRQNIYYGEGLVVSAKSQVAEGAYKWCAWFAQDPEATAIQCKVVFPTYTKAYTDPAISSRWLVAPRPKGMIDAAKEHVEQAKLWRVEAHGAELDTIYYNEIGRLWSNEAKAAEVAKKITEDGNAALAKPVGG